MGSVLASSDGKGTHQFAAEMPWKEQGKEPRWPRKVPRVQVSHMCQLRDEGLVDPPKRTKWVSSGSLFREDRLLVAAAFRVFLFRRTKGLVDPPKRRKVGVFGFSFLEDRRLVAAAYRVMLFRRAKSVGSSCLRQYPRVNDVAFFLR